MRRLLTVIALVLPLAAHAQTTDSQSAQPQTAEPQTTQPQTQTQTQPPASGWQQKFIAKFDAANTTHDGHLTLAQAQAAGMKRIVKNFSKIDTDNKGYVTLDDLRAWHKAQHHQSSAQAQPATS